MKNKCGHYKTVFFLSGGQGVVGSNPIVPTNKINSLGFYKFSKMKKNLFRDTSRDTILNR